MESPETDIVVRKDDASRLYEALIGGRVGGSLAFETTGGKISLTHSYVDPELRHRGIASALAHFALDDLKRTGQRAGVYCGFVADYVDNHPEWRDVVDLQRSHFIATRESRPGREGL